MTFTVKLTAHGRWMALVYTGKSITSRRTFLSHKQAQAWALAKVS